VQADSPAAAFGHGAGIWLPHSTYAMLSNKHLHRIPLSQADSGTRVGWIKWGPWFYPTAAYRVY
jgi:hypothetical protein